jgi:hypothetical protein
MVISATPPDFICSIELKFALEKTLAYRSPLVGYL